MRIMKRLVLFLALVVGAAGSTACSKPSAEDCRKAVLNLQRIRGLDTSAHAPDVEQFVRKCRATGSPESVHCIVNAKTEAEVSHCELPSS
jgi:hypothetical protein